MSFSIFIIIALFFLHPFSLQSQADRWQQAISYEMNVDVEVKDYTFAGTQKILYSNNSPDTLHKLFFHLYFNAFQPNSMMDMRSRTIADPDRRVGDRISKLNKKDWGRMHVQSLKINGQTAVIEEVGTILEVTLPMNILPQSGAVIELSFEGQVPEQIRRSGKNNKEGIALSMAQWYPKLCEYDYQGWHANPYVGREFYGVWGDFDVKINIDADYILAGTGVLQNPQQIGHGYAEVPRINSKKLTWHFKAENVHDFVWAADPNYTHSYYKAKDGTLMRFFYVKDEKTEDAWSKLPPIMAEVFEIIGSDFGKYPYPEYSFIQAGDGGMEYPMATLITGHRSLPSLVGVSIHELVHSWYQMILGTNESLYAWMDEGFTSYVSTIVMNTLHERGLLPGKVKENPHESAYKGYVNFSQSGYEEPMSTHADHFQTNQAYAVSSYTKGSVFLAQLKYIIGADDFQKGMLRYFDVWKFKHPNVNDFIRIMEKQSGIELDWYKEYWVQTTHTIDYAVDTIVENKKYTNLILKKVGVMPMPLDIVVTTNNDKKLHYYIPLRMMRGVKPLTDEVEVVEDWPWTHPEYILEVPLKKQKIKSVEIDPAQGMADINRENNVFLNQQAD